MTHVGFTKIVKYGPWLAQHPLQSMTYLHLMCLGSIKFWKGFSKIYSIYKRQSDVEKKRQRKILYPLVHSPNGWDSQNWSGRKPGGWNSMWIPHVGDRNSSHCTIICFLSQVHYWGAQMESATRTWAGAPLWDASIAGRRLTHWSASPQKHFWKKKSFTVINVSFPHSPQWQSWVKGVSLELRLRGDWQLVTNKS